MDQVKTLEDRLNRNWESIYNDLAIQDTFFSVINEMPQSLSRTDRMVFKYVFRNNNPRSAVDNFLDKVLVSQDINMWKDFIKALDKVNKTTRKRLVSFQDYLGNFY